MDPNGGDANNGTKPIRRRNRMINSCLECRKRKLKCSKTSPSCTNCLKCQRDCLYLGPRLDEASQLRLAEIKEKQGTLERQLEQDVAKAAGSTSVLRQRILADEVDEGADERERELEATPLAALDLTYEDDGQGADDMIDLGIQIGKMRITERIGGLSRPRISEEISAGLSTRPPGMPPPPPSQPGSGQPHTAAPMYENEPIMSPLDGPLPDFLRPGSEYIVPSSGLFFGQVGEHPALPEYLPPKAAADRLMGQYLTAVHPIAPCSHRPSLQALYVTFWEEIVAGFEPRPSTQAVIFAALFSAVLSMDEHTVVADLGGYPQESWVAALKMGTETALSKANFLRTTKVETMQAFIMYMIPLCRAEVSRAHSVLVGAAVRMAECMGLHRDGEAYGLTPLETHVRRLIWHQLCFLDIRTCEAQGPKPVIRREDYDTKLPLNCDEDELTYAVTPPESADRWTTNTTALIRFEINEMMRIIWLDRRRLENRKTTLTAVLTKIENFRRRRSEKYDHLLDVGEPLQRYAKCVMYLLTYRLHIMALHPYHSNAAAPLPSRLSHLLITSGIMVVELAIQLETNPLFRPWVWYLGAYFQYQIALLLATEVYYRPRCREADRIWACLDYVFGMDRRMPAETKALGLLAEIQDRTAVYTRMRRMRGPTSLARAMPSSSALSGTGQTTSQQQLQSQQHQNQHQHQQGRRTSSDTMVSSVKASPPDTTSNTGGGGGGGGGVMHQPAHFVGGINTQIPAATAPSTTKIDPGYLSPLQSDYSPSHHHPPQHQQPSQQHIRMQQTANNHNHGLNHNLGVGGGGGGDGSGGGGVSSHNQNSNNNNFQQQNMVFAGVSDGQVLWGLPPSTSSSSGGGGAQGGNNSSNQHASPGSSDTSSVVAATVAGLMPGGSGGGGNGGGGGGSIMDGIDWDTINTLFPIDPHTGGFSIQRYHDVNFPFSGGGGGGVGGVSGIGSVSGVDAASLGYV